jgi:UDP-N-acetyl-D-mannosaminuronic acid dehydrogenase
MVDDHICVIGLGYIGLPTALMFSTRGSRVTGVDNDCKVIEGLNSRILHKQENGIKELLQKAFAMSKLALSPVPVEADVFIIAVPTPIKRDKSVDMSCVVSAVESIIPILNKGNMVILESTLLPRTTLDVVKPILEKSGLKCGDDIDLVYSPERILPGKVLDELLNNDRVVGGVSPRSAKRAQALYQRFVKGEIFCTDLTTAEMIKLMENTYRDVNIALANEFSRIAHEQKINVWEAISLANRHPRVEILNPGPGVGGHCTSIDPWFIVEASPSQSHLIRTARELNDAQPKYLLDFLEREIGSVEGKSIAALGLSYKPDIDDVRESPALRFVELLNQHGANVIVFDPYVADPRLPWGIAVAKSTLEAIAWVDVIVFLVAHDSFKQLIAGPFSDLVSRDRSKVVVLDSVNLFPENDHMPDGFRLIKLGRGIDQTADVKIEV